MNDVKKPQTVIIKFAALAACLPFASTDDTRAYLTGVYVHWKDGATAYVATDGHKMCLAQPRHAVGLSDVLGEITTEHEGAILQRDDIRTLLSWVEKKPIVAAQDYALMEIHPGGELVFIVGREQIKHSKAIDATYPDYMRVMPKEDKELKAEAVGFNAQFLGLISKVCKAGFAHEKTYSVKAHHYGASEPAKFTMMSPEQDKATVIIMPMRV